MPPLRRSRRLHRWAPYGKDWLSQFRSRRGRNRTRDGGDDLDNNGTALTDDALSAIFARFSDTADIFRCASTCRRWGRVVAQAAVTLSHALPPLPRLALGLFHQEDAAVSAQPCFVPTASGTCLLGFKRPSFSALSEAIHGAGRRFFAFARPVAFRNGRLVLGLPREGGLKLCVCNPMTGDMALLAPLSGDDNPGFYVCTLLGGDDLDPPRPSGTLFSVLIVYSRRKFTALRSYSSETGCWSREVKMAGPRINGMELRKLSQGVVLRGVAYWPLRRTLLAVRFDTPEPMEVFVPTDGGGDCHEKLRLLGVSPDGKLLFIRAGFYFARLIMSVRVFEHSGSGDDTMCSGQWGKKDVFQPTVYKLGVDPTLRLRWFCEKSGVLLFTLGNGSDNPGPGTFALNLATHEIEKLAGGAKCDSWDNFVGYEMDGAAYLATSMPCL